MIRLGKSKFWYGPCPRKKKLREGWEYTEAPDGFLTVKAPDGTRFYISKNGTLIQRI
jgi:hypothetical protein